MKDYKLLAVKYLQKNKRRTATTVFGVMLSVIVLFTIMNLAYCYVLTQREKLRAQGDYEIILLTDSTAIANQVVLKDYVVSVDTGSYFHPYLKKMLEDPVLFVKVDKPEKAYDYMDELERLYGVEVLGNEELLGLYMQGDASVGLILILTLILFAYIFAIFGVGIIRNSIQLTLLEQIKDFGILRCIGATKKQLCAFVYLMGAILEMTGIVLGVALGYPVCLVIGKHFDLVVGFYMWIVLFVAGIFLFDLFFVMWENCRSINEITPIEAVRGQFRIRKEKIKVRRSKLIRKLFGIEGEYAYKSMLRHPGRFYKAVGSIAFGIAAFVTIAGINGTVYNQMDELEKRYGYYQAYFFVYENELLTSKQLQEKVPDLETMEKLKRCSGVEAGKKIYLSTFYIADYAELVNHIQPDYRNRAARGKKYNKDNIEKQKEKPRLAAAVSQVEIFGMDEEDLARIDKRKVKGTLDVSENGIILFNKVYDMLSEEETDSLVEEYEDFRVTNYEVGDTIEVVDPVALRNRYKEKLPEYKKSLEEEAKEQRIQSGLSQEESTEEELEEQRFVELIGECKKELEKEGKTKIFTIEAVVDDYNGMIPTDFAFALPVNSYSSFIGRDESVYSGFKFRINLHKNVDDLSNYLVDLDMCDEGGYYYYYYVSPLSYLLQMYETWRKAAFYITMVVLFIVIMSSLNIMNTTASNLYLRKRELAQLRVIGVSKKKLYYIVILEGVITLFIASLIGLLIGYGAGMGLMSAFIALLGWKFRFSWGVFLLCVGIFGVVLCGTDYISIREMNQELAEDLKANGD